MSNRLKWAFVIGCMALAASIAVYALAGAPTAAAALDRLRNEVAALHPPASSTEVSRDEYTKAGTARVSIGFRDGSTKDVLRTYYNALLTDRGWVETRTRPLNAADPAAFEVCYRRDDLMAQLGLGENGVGSYILSLDWGIDRC